MESKMEWVLRSPQIHSTFSNLGFLHADGYHINENCNEALETILHNILTEDKYLRTYRRSIRFGHNIKNDLIPLLIHAKEDVTVELLIRILVNLTIPIECLLSVDVAAKNDFGRHTIFELTNLLGSTKAAFTDHRTTKVIIEFLKKNVDFEQTAILTSEQCTNISNSLLLLRNILHIPVELNCQNPGYNGPPRAIQNKILWNIFSQSIDKVLIKLMIIPDANKWGVTMVQLIALLYKDQHVVTLHKLLNLWLEASLSESSEDNESNTSPPDRGSDDSSQMFTSDPTSDSSDTGASGKSNDDPNADNKAWESQENNDSLDNNQSFQILNKKDSTESDSEEKNFSIDDDTVMKSDNEIAQSCSSDLQSNARSEQVSLSQNDKKNIISETSDCGYGTQIENQGSISTSSNEDELPTKKPVHQKPHNPKQRANTKVRTSVSMQERKRKKIVKRGKSNIINVQGLSHKTPTDDDISNVLKEFTVDFLLKGYNSLVQTLHNQILTNLQLEIDTSHFFWLVTYFLKFAAQIELDTEHVSCILSFDIASYLAAEGVNLCEQFELAIKLDGNDLKPTIRRLHLVVTALREIIQAIEAYKKFTHVCKNDKDALVRLQIQMCDSEELRSLLVLLLRHYNPKYHSKQYLQDLVVTNHILLMFLDNTLKMPEYRGTTNILDHIRQFASPEIMYTYGTLLEDYAGNGEFVNDCVFTMMHHIGGDVESLITLYQPKILRTFTTIWKSEYEICDDWSDLIEYVINTFIKKPQPFQHSDVHFETECFGDEKIEKKSSSMRVSQSQIDVSEINIKKKSSRSDAGNVIKENWTEEEQSSLSWKYMQCSVLPDVIGEIIKLFKEDGVVKSRISVVHEIFRQNVINNDEYENFMKGESDRNANSVQIVKEMRDDEISKICEQLALDGKLKSLEWVQKVLLETCNAKICIEKKSREISDDNMFDNTETNWINLRNSDVIHLLSPVSYHSLVLNQSVPLVPWNCTQASICKDLKFLQLLHKLGFHMPVDSGKVFIRIPLFWTADYLYDVASKILPIDKTKLKFSLDDISASVITNSKQKDDFLVSVKVTNDFTLIGNSDNFYQIHKQKHVAMVNFTPTPSCSFNSEIANADQPNWLEVVKKSQEYKINLNVDSMTEEKKDDQPDVEFRVPLKDALSPVGPQLLANIIPDIMNIKPPILSSPVAESEYYNNSICETASVASDLTRMYVSDEDEKPDVLEVSSLVDDLATDCDDPNVCKRPRIQFVPLFD